MEKTPSEWAAQAIDILGGPTKAAALITEAAMATGTARPISRQSVEYWVRERVPAEFCPLVEQLTRARGKPVLCENVRPDIAWGEVRNPIDVVKA
jgi:DNA-binding transcriptional regulator YdaS (Cro superfamily)